uniref:Juvenile hormone binding protein n=1 Tax=Riptortus pedestris TaxID=329032 RepID=R4WE37_RIPPE|nr:unknown secreted protein [Riptortus pedestris]
MMKILALLLLASLANADTVININKQVDEKLKVVNSLMTERGFGLQLIPKQKFQDIELENGALVGANSLQRPGDATVTIRPSGNTTVDLQIGWHLFATAFGLIKTQGLQFSGVVNVRDSSFHFAYDIAIKPECKVTLTHLEYERLADVQFIGSLPETDQDLSDIYSQQVLPYFNELIAPAKRDAEESLQAHLCHQPKGVLASKIHVAAVFDTLAVFLDKQ